MPATIQVAYHSERGRRKQNEDMFAIPVVLQSRPLPERGESITPDSHAIYARKGYLLALGDGVGGREGGEQASAQAVQEIARRYYDDPSPDLLTSLQRVIEAANRQLHRLCQVPGMPARMATTITVVVLKPPRLLAASVGDSRAYLLREEEVTLITSDHSWVQEQINQGRLTEMEAALDPQRHRITRSLGRQTQVGVDVWQQSLQSGDRILLCSDGLSSYLSPADIGQIAGRKPLQKAVNRLIDTAYDRGSHDNITAVLAEVAW